MSEEQYNSTQTTFLPDHFSVPTLSSLLSCSPLILPPYTHCIIIIPESTEGTAAEVAAYEQGFLNTVTVYSVQEIEHCFLTLFFSLLSSSVNYTPQWCS